MSASGGLRTLDPLPIPHFPPLQIPGGATDAASQDLTEFLFCSSAVLDPTVGHTVDVLSPFISVILIDSSTGSPVHVLMLSIQAVRGLPGLLQLALFLALVYLFLQATPLFPKYCQSRVYVMSPNMLT